MAFRPAGLLASMLPGLRPDVCRGCGVALPSGRRWQCEACDARAHAARPVPPPPPPHPSPGTGEEGLEGVCEASLLAGRPRLDAPGFPTDEWSSPALAAVRAWVEGRGRAPGAGLWLYGGAGSGKTTILAGLVLQLRAAGEQVALMTMAGMLGALRTATMCDAAHYEALLDRLGEVPVLALDDVLVRPLSEFQAEAVEQVLNTRWNAGLPVLATSNHALMGMAPGAVLRGCQSVGDVTFSRLRSRLRACAAVEIACFYPGDRRTGDFDKALAATWRAARAQRGGR